MSFSSLGNHSDPGGFYSVAMRQSVATTVFLFLHFLFRIDFQIVNPFFIIFLFFRKNQPIEKAGNPHECGIPGRKIFFKKFINNY